MQVHIAAGGDQNGAAPAPRCREILDSPQDSYMTGHCLETRQSHDPHRPDHAGRADPPPQAAGGEGEPCGPHARGAARGADRGGDARTPGPDAGEPDLAVDLSMGRAGFRRHDQSRQGLPRRSGRALRHRDARGGEPAGERGRHPQIPGSDRGRARGGGGLYPRDGSRHAVHFLSGGLHADLFLLPYRHAEAGAQPDRGRDHRAGHARAR